MAAAFSERVDPIHHQRTDRVNLVELAVLGGVLSLRLLHLLVGQHCRAHGLTATLLVLGAGVELHPNAAQLHQITTEWRQGLRQFLPLVDASDAAAVALPDCADAARVGHHLQLGWCGDVLLGRTNERINRTSCRDDLVLAEVATCHPVYFLSPW